MTEYHLPETDFYHTLLMEYACGTLDETMSLLCAAHLTLSPRARERVALYESMGGVLMEKGCTPVAMSKDSLRTVLDQLDQAEKSKDVFVKKPETPCSRTCSLPQPLYRLFAAQRVEQPRAWRRVARGVRVIAAHTEPQSLSQDGDSRTVRLYRIRPGGQLPRLRLTEQEKELLLVLEGALCRQDQTRYTQGTMVVTRSGSALEVKACPDEGCMYLAVGGGSHTGLAGLMERLLGL